MLQSEVAARLTAVPGSRDYGSLTLAVSLFAAARVLFRVGPASFLPRPRVESSVVSIVLRDEPRVSVDDLDRFREIVRASFGQRRKTLRNALSKLVPAAEIERAGVDPGRRGETLSLEEFARLANGASR